MAKLTELLMQNNFLTTLPVELTQTDLANPKNVFRADGTNIVFIEIVFIGISASKSVEKHNSLEFVIITLNNSRFSTGEVCTSRVPFSIFYSKF